MKVSLGPAKGKDSATTLGPWLVTADELEPYRDADGFLALDMRVVGQRHRRSARTCCPTWAGRSRSWSPTPPAAPRSAPGDVLGSGTCGNGGCLAELWGRRGELDPPPLQPGDVVEMTVEGIGTIRNRVVAGVDLPPVPPPGRGRAARGRAAKRHAP